MVFLLTSECFLDLIMHVLTSSSAASLKSKREVGGKHVLRILRSLTKYIWNLCKDSLYNHRRLRLLGHKFVSSMSSHLPPSIGPPPSALIPTSYEVHNHHPSLPSTLDTNGLPTVAGMLPWKYFSNGPLIRAGFGCMVCWVRWPLGLEQSDLAPPYGDSLSGA